MWKTINSTWGYSRQKLRNYLSKKTLFVSKLTVQHWMLKVCVWNVMVMTNSLQRLRRMVNHRALRYRDPLSNIWTRVENFMYSCIQVRFESYITSHSNNNRCLGAYGIFS
ncbi:hypothetical protein HA402_000828 [Bradysia odoriphaga]|nr:hypothetical protein HA402_000828 [Bradysia odoriphaga]